jgi:plasmid replication initiation protein
MTIHNPDPTRPKLKKLETRWISSIGYFPEEGKIALCFAQNILPYLSGLKGTFTKYELKHVGNMNSVYAIRLYELLMQWKSAGKREIAIDWLKKQFQIENLYPDMHNFKKRVINPAVKEINEHSNFSVSWEQRKTGRKVTHLTFTFAEKQPETTKPKRSYAKKEKTVYGVPMSEINRLARAGETVEQVAARINREREEAKATKNPPKTATKPQTKPKPTETKPEAAETKAAIFESLRAAALGS